MQKISRKYIKKHSFFSFISKKHESAYKAVETAGITAEKISKPIENGFCKLINPPSLQRGETF